MWRIILNCSFTLFTDVEPFNQTKSWLKSLVSLASLLCDPLCLPFKTGTILTPALGIQTLVFMLGQQAF